MGDGAFFLVGDRRAGLRDTGFGAGRFLWGGGLDFTFDGLDLNFGGLDFIFAGDLTRFGGEFEGLVFMGRGLVVALGGESLIFFGGDLATRLGGWGDLLGGVGGLGLIVRSTASAKFRVNMYSFLALGAR